VETLRRQGPVVLGVASSPSRWAIIAVALVAALALGLAVAALREIRKRRRAPDVLAEAVSSLEQRLTERLDGLGRDVRGAAEFTHGAEEKLLAARDHALAEREGKLDESERELVERKRELDDRDRALAERDRELEERERTLDERLTALTTREVKLARRTVELEERAEQLEAALAAIPVPEQVPEPDPEPEPAAGEPGLSLDGVYHLERLEALVAEKESEFPERAGEWRAYLYFLREHAAPDGSLPPKFAYLIEETFAEVFE
jgi:hypothetical protein